MENPGDSEFRGRPFPAAGRGSSPQAFFPFFFFSRALALLAPGLAAGFLAGAAFFAFLLKGLNL